MKAIFYVLALLVTGAAAYFSYDNVGKFKEQRRIKEETITENADLKSKIAKKTADRDEEVGKLAVARKERQDTSSSIDSLKSLNSSLNQKIKTLDATLEEQKVKFAQLEEALAKIKEILKDLNVESIDEVPGLIGGLKAEQMAKEKQLAELKVGIEVLEKNVADNSAEIARLTERDIARDTRIRRNAMESVVTAVNEDWGFVVIKGGSNTGFTPQTALLVKREGRLVGTVKPSSIEPTQVIAEIDKDTIAPGARIQPGDSVILANPAAD